MSWFNKKDCKCGSFDALLAAKNEVISAWKDRGDRYANHNTALEEELLKLYSQLTALLADPTTNGDYRKLLEEAIKNRK